MQKHSSTELCAIVPGAKVCYLVHCASSLTLLIADLYLRPFLPALRPVYRSQELRDWHSLLLEKGLRVRVEVDGFTEPGSDIEMEEDPPLEDVTEAEGLLREREYLKPY